MASLIPAGVSLLGGMLSSKHEKDAAKSYANSAKFNPFSVFGPAGSSVVDGQNVNISAAPTGFEDWLTAMSAQGFGGMLGMSQFGPMASFMPALSRMSMSPTMGGAAGGMGPNVRTPGMPGRAGSMDFASWRDAHGGMGPGMRRLPRSSSTSGLDFAMPSFMGAGGGMGGDFNILGNFAQLQRMLGGGIDGSNPVRGLPGLGQAFANASRGSLNNVLDINAMTAERKAQLDALAKPGEQKFYNKSLDRLFSSGQMGTSGGNSQLADVLQGLERAQTERDIASTDYARSNAFQERGQNAELAGAFGNAAMGIDSAMFDRRMGLDQLGIERAMQRFQAAQGMFEYGRDIANEDFARSMGIQEFMRALRGDATEMANVSTGMGSAASSANAAAFAPMFAAKQNTAGSIADAFSAFGTAAGDFFNKPKAPVFNMGGWGVRSAPMPGGPNYFPMSFGY